MSWAEFQAHIAAMNRQIEARNVKPDRWDGADQDQWWVEQRRKRAEEQRRGF